MSTQISKKYFVANELTPGCHCKGYGNMFADGLTLTLVNAADCGGVIGDACAVITSRCCAKRLSTTQRGPYLFYDRRLLKEQHEDWKNKNKRM